MKGRILSSLVLSLVSGGLAAAQDTLWIDPATPGALETAINADTAIGGARAHPLRVYGLHKDGVYVQNAGISFKGGGMLTIVGEKGGAYPVVQMQAVNGVDPGDLTNGIANKIEGSLHLDHIYWLGRAADGTQYNQLFGMTTVDGKSQGCFVNDCITEFIGIDTFNGDGWNHGSTWKFTNCYFRRLLSGGQWWGGRVMYCKKPIDTIWVENCTVTNGGMTFLQQEAVTRFAWFNHNTFINDNKYWLYNQYFVNLFVVNNLFTNENWVGEDSVNILTSGSAPRPARWTGTIGIDTITIQQQLFSDMIDGSIADSNTVGLNHVRIYVSNNIAWTDTLLNSYYRNYGRVWNSIAPYPLSYLNWAGKGTGPWQIVNIPGVWMNDHTAGIIAAHPHNMAMTHNIFTKVETRTPSISGPNIVTLMGKWNQNQWSDPANYATATADLMASDYLPGDNDANTLPGYTNGGKSENAQTSRVAKIPDFTENYAQATTPVVSTIDGQPIGALIWDGATVPASSYAAVLAHYAQEITSVTPLPGVAGTFALSQNYPNPFNPSTKIEFTIPGAGNVDLVVYNVLGQEVATLVHGTLAAGRHAASFDGKNLASGVYIYRLTAGANIDTKKMVILK